VTGKITGPLVKSKMYKQPQQWVLQPSHYQDNQHMKKVGIGTTVKIDLPKGTAAKVLQPHSLETGAI
jgi:hypothetical protein